MWGDGGTAGAADYELLTAAGRAFSRPLEEVPAAVGALQETAKDSAKQVKALAVELAGYKGRALFLQRHRPGGIGKSWTRLMNRHGRWHRRLWDVGAGGILSATGGGAALVASSDPAVHCGNLLKQFGRGGEAGLAQGSVGDAGLLAEALGF